MECTCGVNLQRWMTLYLKSLKVDGRPMYSIEKINDLPTVIGCVVSFRLGLTTPLFNINSEPIIGAGVAFDHFYSGGLRENACTHYCVLRADSTRCIHCIPSLVE